MFSERAFGLGSFFPVQTERKISLPPQHLIIHKHGIQWSWNTCYLLKKITNLFFCWKKFPVNYFYWSTHQSTQASWLSPFVLSRTIVQVIIVRMIWIATLKHLLAIAGMLVIQWLNWEISGSEYNSFVLSHWLERGMWYLSGVRDNCYYITLQCSGSQHHLHEYKQCVLICRDNLSFFIFKRKQNWVMEI